MQMGAVPPLESIEVTVEQLLASGYESVIATCDASYRAYGGEFEKACLDALASERTAAAPALQLLAAACSPALRASDARQPFYPLSQFGDRRSVVPSDLTKAQVEVLVQLSEVAPDAELTA